MKYAVSLGVDVAVVESDMDVHYHEIEFIEDVADEFHLESTLDPDQYYDHLRELEEG